MKSKISKKSKEKSELENSDKPIIDLNNSDISSNQLVENLKKRNLVKFIGDFSLDVIFSKLHSSDKKVNIDKSRKILEELIFMVNSN